MQALIASSTRGLSTNHYTPEQIEAAIAYIFGVDSELLADKTYFVVEENSGSESAMLACGGWSQRKTLYGGDQYAAREEGLLNPETDAAKIRAFFVSPAASGKGVGAALLRHCEQQALSHGFSRAELMSTMPAVSFYERMGYVRIEPSIYTTPNGVEVPFVKMGRALIHDKGTGHVLEASAL